tara:strand:- start:1637 stop:2065 length:429 start_codon:yes stop_codon:yes gene_type:complete
MESKKVEKIIIEWDDFESMATKMAMNYADKKLTRIVGLSRGGLPIGVKLSNLLGVPFTPLVWQTRSGAEQDVLGLLQIEKKNDIETTLFVDDICDSGTTIAQVNDLVKGITWAVLINKIPGSVDYAAEVMEGDEWIEFPWET